MNVTFQLFDCDYISLNNTPIVRLFGKTKDNKTVCAFFEGYKPYFYVLPKSGFEEAIRDFLIEKFKSEVIDIEWVEKFLPINFQTSKIKMLKVTLNDPSKIPSVRDSLLEKGFVEKIFEADILFKYRFMADYNISGMKWYKVTGDFSTTNTVNVDKKIIIKSIEEVPIGFNSDLKYLAIDIETISKNENPPNPKEDFIAMISLFFSPKFNNKDSLVLISKPVKETENVLMFRNEHDMLEEFVKIIDSFDPDIIVGYNINNFDLPFIVERLTQNKIPRTIGRCKQKPIISKKVGSRYKVSITGRIVVDVYELIKESIGKGLLRLKRYGLGDVSEELLNEKKIEITRSEIPKYWKGTDEQIKQLIEYTRKDSQLALRLLLEKNMLDKFIEISKVSGLLLQDVLNSGEAVRIENLLLREFDKEGFVLPLKPSSEEILKRKAERETKSLKGALVLEPEIGLHTNCVVYLDFKAMYPSIFISYNICPTTLVSGEQKLETIKTPYGVEFVSKKVREGLFPRIIKKLIEERDRIRKEMKSVKDESEKRNLDAKQYALKIMANAFYGYTGYLLARLYVLDIANAVTSCGRFLIRKTKEIVEKIPDVSVIYGDTDSIIIKTSTTDLDEAFKIGKNVEEKINDEFKDIVQTKIENVFKTFLVLTKKRYVGLSLEKINDEWKEQIVMKGIETVRRDWCDLTSDTLYEVLNILLKEQNPKKALLYVKDILLKLNRNEIPIEKLVVTKGISKPLREYKGIQPHIELVKKIRKRAPAEAPGIGDRIGYVIVQGPELISERAEDPNYVKEHNLKIDSKYYIESQVLPPLERVFEAIGVTKSELFGLGRQLGLMEVIKTEVGKPEKKVLNEIDGFICSKCNQTFDRVPLVGRCDKCGGEILFYYKNIKTRYYSAT